MPDFQKASEILKRYTVARIPFVVIDSIEPARAMRLIRKVTEGEDVVLYSMTRGMVNATSGKTESDDTGVFGAVRFMSARYAARRDTIFVLNGGFTLDHDCTDTRQLLDAVSGAVRADGMIIAISSGTVWSRLQRSGMRLTLDLPTETELTGVIESMLSGYRGTLPIEWDANDVVAAAQMLSGLTELETQNVIADLLAKQSVTRADLDSLRFVRDRLFTDITGLERINVTDTDRYVGGLKGLRNWLEEHRKLRDPMIMRELRQAGMPAPRGILLTGVPGCGKSMSAKAVAADWDLPLYRLDFATVQGSYVGQSEQQLRDALDTAARMAPCILWIDEIEKGLSGVNASDGGVSARMVGQFLFWLQECRAQVFVIATANDVSRLPAELLRRGRFDELFFIDLPGPGEREEILRMYLRRYLDEEPEPAWLAELVRVTEGFSGADLESAVRDMGYYRRVHGKDMTYDEAKDLFGRVIPLIRQDPERIGMIRAWGKERARSASEIL